MVNNILKSPTGKNIATNRLTTIKGTTNLSLYSLRVKEIDVERFVYNDQLKSSGITE